MSFAALWESFPPHYRNPNHSDAGSRGGATLQNALRLATDPEKDAGMKERCPDAILPLGSERREGEILPNWQIFLVVCLAALTHLASGGLDPSRATWRK